jgi:hypothetical protein
LFEANIRLSKKTIFGTTIKVKTTKCVRGARTLI